MLNRRSIFIVVIVFVFWGCNIKSPSAYYGTVDLSFSIQNESRTILYNLTEENIEQIRIDFISGPVDLESVLLPMDEQLSLDLLYGNWEIALYGIDSEGNEIAYSSAVFSVSASQNTDLDIGLSALSNNTIESDASGIVELVFDWSTVDNRIKAEVNEIHAYFGVVGNTLKDISSELKIDLSSNTAVLNMNPCISGNFILELLFLNSDNDVIASVSEAVNVRDFLLTEGTINLQDEDFSLAGVNLNITIDILEVEDISFNFTNDSVFTSADLLSGVQISVTNSEIYNSYFWSLYGYTLTSDIDFVVLPFGLSSGVHHLTVFVEKDGNLFSETLRFIVKDS